ncbi:hypothetical protein PQR34_18610 [Paraburkholderia sediminicola]|jgi:hypothetical protein|uniref:hypothetical protein n=1 Tax=Paraburkholderia sediminicola TaxID=458836 RepID=UPI0038BAE884
MRKKASRRKYPGLIELAEPSRTVFGTLEFLSSATTPFAVIGVDCTIPTTPVMLNPLAPGWELASALSWSATISYTSNGRNDSVSFQGMSDVWSPIQIDFQGNVQGGIITLSISAPVVDSATGKKDVLQWGQSSTIIGTYPIQNSLIRQYVGDLTYQVLAYVESRFQQFLSDGSPKFGNPKGFGVMQLDKAPVTARQIWDWMQNADEGKRRFVAGNGNVIQHYANLKKTSPSLRALLQDEILTASFTYYNGGPRKELPGMGFYYVPAASNDDWVRNPNPTGDAALNRALDYGDNAMSTLMAVQNDHPPVDWG